MPGVKVCVGVSEQELIDLVITAVEGGYTRNWAQLSKYNYKTGTVTIREVSDGEVDGKPIRVTPAVIARGLKRAAKAEATEGGWAFAKWLSDRIGDAIIADVILQFGVLGEVRYG